MKNVLLKMKGLWTGLITILSVNDKHNNYGLDLSTDLSVNLTFNIFHVSKIQPYVKNNCTLFSQSQLDKPEDVLQERYNYAKLVEYRKTPTTCIPQCKVSWLEYSVEDDQ